MVDQSSISHPKIWMIKECERQTSILVKTKNPTNHEGINTSRIKAENIIYADGLMMV